MDESQHSDLPHWSLLFLDRPLLDRRGTFSLRLEQTLVARLPVCLLGSEYVDSQRAASILLRYIQDRDTGTRSGAYRVELESEHLRSLRRSGR